MSARWRVASYNVHGCVGRDGRRDPARTARALRELDAAVIGLQEVDSRGHADAIEGQLQELARAVDQHAIAGPTLLEPSGHYGNALLTSLPVLSITRHDLSVPPWEPRGALVVELQAEATPCHVIVTHLGLRHRERTQQIDRLATLTREITGPLVVLGDFNEWTHRRLVRQSFARGNPRGPRTFPSWLPLLPLDVVFARAPARVERIDRFTPQDADASDHLPVVATVHVE
jgi:endonuclease/exonuclease/phosphatase family metal-dependent hydrolase